MEATRSRWTPRESKRPASGRKTGALDRISVAALLKFESLLLPRQGRFALEFFALVAKHRRRELPRRSRRIAPGRRYRDHAVFPAGGVEIEESSVPPDQYFPFLKRGTSRFDQPALRGNLCKVKHSSGNHEIEFVRVAHPDAPLEWMLELA